MDKGSNGLPPNKHFYRRTLPLSCIAFSSSEGKQLFRESLLAGHMECYFKLASQFRTQDEPAFCGLSTMVMVLNALDVDPGRVWKGVWRWYHENMLDCCVPLEIVEQQGINFDQFICVAECNSLTVESTRMDDGAMSLSDFRDLVKEYTRQDDKFIVLSYSRKVLGQTGDGHFSPLAGYNPEQDMVLMLDTARFKYPPHWVKTELIFQAMKAIDKATNMARGLMLLSKSEDNQHLLLFRLANDLSMTAPGKFIPEFVVKWKQELEKTAIKEDLDDDGLCLKSASTMIEILAGIDNGAVIMTTQLDVACPQDVTSEQKCLVYQLLKALVQTVVFKKVTEILKTLSEEKLDRVLQVFDMRKKHSSCQACSTLVGGHFISFLLLSWPYKLHCHREETLVASQYYKVYTDQLLLVESYILRSEVNVLRGQLEVIVKAGEGNVVVAATSSVYCCKKKAGKSALDTGMPSS